MFCSYLLTGNLVVLTMTGIVSGFSLFNLQADILGQSGNINGLSHTPIVTVAEDDVKANNSFGSCIYKPVTFLYEFNCSAISTGRPNPSGRSVGPIRRHLCTYGNHVLFGFDGTAFAFNNHVLLVGLSVQCECNSIYATRSNGLAAMLKQMRLFALAFLSQSLPK